MINCFLAGIINLPAVCRKRGVNEKKIFYDRGLSVYFWCLPLVAVRKRKQRQLKELP